TRPELVHPHDLAARAMPRSGDRCSAGPRTTSRPATRGRPTPTPHAASSIRAAELTTTRANGWIGASTKRRVALGLAPDAVARRAPGVAPRSAADNRGNPPCSAEQTSGKGPTEARRTRGSLEF